MTESHLPFSPLVSSSFSLLLSHNPLSSSERGKNKFIEKKEIINNICNGLVKEHNYSLLS